MWSQGRAIPHEPDMPEGIDKTPLAMHAPGRLVISDLVHTAVCAGLHSPRDEAIGIVAKYFDPSRRDAKFCWTLPAVVPGLTCLMYR
jgi:hypothetical protein